MVELTFNRDFSPEYGKAVQVGPGVRRLTAPNPGPFTFTGTNTYLIGTGEIAIVDPGPASAPHLAALLAATADETITHILITHRHRDHVDGVKALAEHTGARTHAFSHHAGVVPALLNSGGLDAEGDRGFAPDVVLADGDILAGPTWRLEAVATPGHASDHVAFALPGSGILLSGDHVMGWSTSVVAPPDGSMADYMASLDRLLARTAATYFPGHGPPISGARSYVLALKAHRLEREAAILASLSGGPRSVPEIVAQVYTALDPRLAAAAGLSVLAHLIDLAARGLVAEEGAGRYRVIPH
jgi:glyoxylase-like metal-dependent hydrolase (beta-lactamase superfamily II)